MVIDEDPFLPVASINTSTFDLKALIDSNKARTRWYFLSDSFELVSSLGC